MADLEHSECDGWMSVTCSYLLLCVQITIEAMKSDIDEVALQGIEFWSNVCDEEMDLAIEATEVMRDAAVTSFSVCCSASAVVSERFLMFSVLRPLNRAVLQSTPASFTLKELCSTWCPS